MLLKEVFAVGAHVLQHGETVLKFGAIADKLNNSGYLPWMTKPKAPQALRITYGTQIKCRTCSNTKT
jgi:hypothetical protein